MNVKMLLMLLMILGLTGCSVKEKPVDIYYPIEVVTTVQCKVPDVFCNYNNKDITLVEVVKEMYICIQEQRKAMEVCK